MTADAAEDPLNLRYHLHGERNKNFFLLRLTDTKLLLEQF